MTTPASVAAVDAVFTARFFLAFLDSSEKYWGADTGLAEWADIARANAAATIEELEAFIEMSDAH